MPEEAASGRIRRKRTGPETATAGARSASRHDSPASTRDSACMAISTYCNVYEYFTSPWSIKRNACLAEQGRKKCGDRDRLAQCPPSGTRATLPVQLAGNHSRRVGVANNTGLQDRVPAKAQSKGKTSSAYLHREGGGVYANRGPEHAEKAGNFSGITEPRGFLLSDVSGSEKRWQAETCDKPETIKPVSEDRALQDGRHSHAERPAKSRRLDGKDRPERCLLHDSHCSGGQRVPQIPMEGSDVPVQLSSVRVVVSPVGLYQDHTAGCGSPAGDRPTYDHLHRRYPRHGGDRVSPQRPCDSSGVPAGEPGVGDKSPQIRTGPLTGNRIPGVHCQLQHNGAEATRGENKENQGRGRQSPAVRHSVSSDPVPTDWEDECGHAGHSDGPPVLQEPPDLPPRGLAGGSELLLNNSVDKGGERGAGVVERSLHSVEWSESHSSQLLPHHRDRCLENRVGGSVQWIPDRGTVDPRGEIHAHQLPGAPGSLPGSEMFCKGQNKPDHQWRFLSTT